MKIEMNKEIHNALEKLSNAGVVPIKNRGNIGQLGILMATITENGCEIAPTGVGGAFSSGDWLDYDFNLDHESENPVKKIESHSRYTSFRLEDGSKYRLHRREPGLYKYRDDNGRRLEERIPKGDIVDFHAKDYFSMKEGE